MSDQTKTNVNPPGASSAPAPAFAPRGPRGPGRGGSFGGGRGGGGGGSFGRGGPRGGRGRDDSSGFGDGANDFVEKVVYINRSSKVVKGGRRFSFSALVVVGDRRGRVGVGLGKGGEVADSIRKGTDIARRAMEPVALNGATLPHEAFGTFCGAKILLRPASPGTGVIAGKTVRAVLESAGVKDVLSKSLGSNNAANVVKATLTALRQLKTREEILRRRNIPIRPVLA